VGGTLEGEENCTLCSMFIMLQAYALERSVVGGVKIIKEKRETP